MQTRTLAALALVAGVTTAPPTYTINGVQFAGFHAFPAHELILGADTTRRVDLAFIVWAIQPTSSNEHRTVLFDAGFYRQKFVDAWKPTNFVRPSDAISKIGLKPQDVTDIIISHVHWDHLDGADLFPRATVWIQKAEYEHYVGTDGMPLSPTLDTADAQMLVKLRRAGRVALIDGDNREIIPGITVYTGGRHTFASEYISVHTPAGVVVLASDNAYYYENLEKHRPIGATFVPADSVANLKAQDRMRTLVSDPRFILPGHDPAIFQRFPSPGNGVAKIE